MSSVKMFPNIEKIENIEIPRSTNFKDIAIEVGNFIKKLPLSTEDNDKLINLIIKQVKEAEHTAFLSGFDLGVKIGKEEGLIK